MKRRNIILAGAIAVVLMGAIVLAYVFGGGSDEADTTKPVGAVPSGLDQYYTQDLEWEECGQAKCTNVQVPIDYEKPDGDTLELRVKVIPSEGESGRSLFVNPGGPGASAHDFADALAGLLGADVLATYDLVAVDPRGVGDSTPIDCVSDRDFDAFIATDPSPDDDAEVDEYRKLLSEFGDGCTSKSGGLVEHVSTEEAARDFDVVRALLGSKTFDWFGFSYGTQLGATYATLFPENVGRMVLDGAVDPSLSQVDGYAGQSKGFDRAVRAYVRDCVRQEACPLGTETGPALDKLRDFLASTDAKPLETGSARMLTEGQAYRGLFYPLYSKESWPFLTQALTAAFKGDGAPLLQAADAYFERGQDGSFSNNSGEAFLVVMCLDLDERATLDETRQAIPRFEKGNPVFGLQDAWALLWCTDLALKSTHPQVPIDAQGSEPIVVIGTTRDPATPYEWSQSLSDQLGTGVLVTREGDGHTAYGSGNPCIDDIVDSYLADGKVPKDGTTCKE